MEESVVDIVLDGKVVGRAVRRTGFKVTKKYQWVLFGTNDSGPLGGWKSRSPFEEFGPTLTAVVNKARKVAPGITVAA